MIRVLLADDQEMVREGLALILDAQADIEVVGQAPDGQEAIRLTEACRPDVVLMDVRMPKIDGIEATRRLRAAAHTARILILTTYDDDDYVLHALDAGATGFLLKDSPRAALLHGIRTVAADQVLLPATATRRLVARLRARSQTPAPELATLTNREREVLQAVAAGGSNAEIATQLHLSHATVKTHVAHLLTKLDQRDRVQLVIFAYVNGVV